jgi:hypothetical protein
VTAALFSEPREWQECEWCQDDPWHRFFNGEDQLDALGPCPMCGQPPRCRVGSATKDRHCPRPATVPLGRDGRPDMCGQHWQANEVSPHPRICWSNRRLGACFSGG